MQKKTIQIFSLITLMLALGGCSYKTVKNNQPRQAIPEIKSEVVNQQNQTPADLKEQQLNEYKSNLISIKYPKNYEVKEKDEMLIVSSANGKIIIGGFKPSTGYPEADKKDFPFREIMYTEDPKLNVDAMPAALYYIYGDTKTKTELSEILKTVKNIEKE